MSGFAAALFTFAMLTAGWTLINTIQAYGALAMKLKHRLENCPQSVIVTWKSAERVSTPSLSIVKTPRVRRAAARLEWSAGYGLAA